MFQGSLSNLAHCLVQGHGNYSVGVCYQKLVRKRLRSNKGKLLVKEPPRAVLSSCVAHLPGLIIGHIYLAHLPVWSSLESCQMSGDMYITISLQLSFPIWVFQTCNVNLVCPLAGEWERGAVPSLETIKNLHDANEGSGMETRTVTKRDQGMGSVDVERGGMSE